jgi:hypothetical protein
VSFVVEFIKYLFLDRRRKKALPRKEAGPQSHPWLVMLQLSRVAEGLELEPRMLVAG